MVIHEIVDHTFLAHDLRGRPLRCRQAAAEAQDAKKTKPAPEIVEFAGKSFEQWQKELHHADPSEREVGNASHRDVSPGQSLHRAAGHLEGHEANLTRPAPSISARA